MYCEIHPWDIGNERVRAFGARGIILSGGPESVTDAVPPAAPLAVFEGDCPVLGICYGMQTMAQQLGGRVAPGGVREFGYAEVQVDIPGRLLQGIADRQAGEHALLDVWMSHGDRVEVLPPGFTTSASSFNAPHAAMTDERRRFYGVQFHPEVTHTRQGGAILERFVREICACEARWTAGNIIEDLIARVRAQVGAERVLLGLSGGVDSSVVAALLHRAIGPRLTCVFVDHGLLRLGEGEEVMRTFAASLGVRVVRIDAAARFFEALRGQADPEAKRKIIGAQFVRVFEEAARAQEGTKFLAQGTIYPDVIESAAAHTGKAHVIKSHHNVGGLPADLKFTLVEPLRELFKDEVRRIGVELGLPHAMVYRHPFPGPGLGVRILGEVRPEFVGLLQRADHIFIEELRRHELYERTAQAFAVFLPVRSVGVMGDGRRYDYVIALRAVATIDFMTAHWAHLPYEFLDLVSRRIVNEVPGISRVVYDISGKPPATIEWE